MRPRDVVLSKDDENHWTAKMSNLNALTGAKTQRQFITNVVCRHTVCQKVDRLLEIAKCGDA